MSAPGDPGRRLVACYGGTFDPVHRGHLGAVLDVLERSGCDELRVIPAALPPLRGVPGATAAQRLQMLELALGDVLGDDPAAAARVRVDALELDREGPSYTVDTLAALRRELGAATALGWVLGTDALARLERWARWRELLEGAHLLVLERPGHPLPATGALGALLAERRVAGPEALRETPGGRLWFVGQRPVAVSATEVRACLDELPASAAREAPDEADCARLLSPSVWAYIRREGLYGVRRA